jgi:hypothetical protein
MIGARISQAYEYVSDVVLREKLKLDYARKAKERVREGPWLKDLHIQELERRVEEFYNNCSNKDDFERRRDRVFIPAVNHYQKVLAKYFFAN